MRPQRGFTLIEVLVALLIFAVLASIVSFGLINVLKMRERTEKSYERLREIQLLSNIMQTDLIQMIDRPVIANNGRRVAAVVGKNDYLEFTRMVESADPTNDKLQRIAYVYRNGDLLRQVWPVLDRAPGTQAISRKLLGSITQWQIYYYNDKGKRLNYWPESGSQAALPQAIEIDFTQNMAGKIRRIWVLE